MTDTAQEFTEPVLDLDAMIEDLHNEFQGDPPGDESQDDATSAGGADTEAAEETGGAPEAPPGPGDPELDALLPPGMVQFGDEVLPKNEVDALIELNRRVKADPDTASRVRAAIIGQQQQTQQQPDADALPAFIDPDDQQAVFLFRQQQRIDRELAEVRQNYQQRAQQQALTQEELRKAEVIDGFRAGMKEFRDEHPTFTPEDLKVLTDKAAQMGLLDAPEKLGGTLRGGFVTALDLAMWSTPEYREKATAGATVRTKEQQSQERKQKSSALSSSTGSVVRTQSQEKTPTTRQEIMAGALDFLRSGAVTD
jgi:hypothetical protein